MLFECGFSVGVDPEAEAYRGCDDGGSMAGYYVSRAESVCSLYIDVDNSS